MQGCLHGRPVAAGLDEPLPGACRAVPRRAPALAALPVATPVPGTTVCVGRPAGCRWCGHSAIIEAGSVPNNASLSLLLNGPQGRVAFLGIWSPRRSPRSLRVGFDLHADIVKVPHHGSAQFVPELPSGVGPRTSP